jgi:hypothetical protein
MYALITDGSISKFINNPKALVIGDVQYPAKIFSLWTNAEREAIGIYEVTFDNTNKKDEQWYTNTNQSYAYDADAGTVTATYGSATAKAHADANATDDDGNDLDPVVVIEGLKTKLIRTVKSQAAGILQNTDWYIVRKADAGTAVPSAITTHRAAVRTKCASQETQITNASDTPALETLYTYTTDGDGVQSRPLGELPILEN